MARTRSCTTSTTGWPLRRRRPRMAAARSGRPVACSEAPRILDLVKDDTVRNDVPLITLGIKSKDAVMTATAPASTIATTVAPWLSVRGGARAVEFYKSAFGATEAFRLEDPGGSVV